MSRVAHFSRQPEVGDFERLVSQIVVVLDRLSQQNYNEGQTIRNMVKEKKGL